MSENNDKHPIAEITTTEQERRIIDLVIGAREPETAEDRRILADIKATKPATIVEFPLNF